MEDYIRNGRGTSFVTDREIEEASGYQMEMLRKNRLCGLLPVQVCAINEQREYHYDAGTQMSLSEYLEKRSINAVMLGEFVRSITGVLAVLEEYLLNTDCLCMEPEHIYIEEKEGGLSFCYVPYVKEGFERGLQKLLQFFLGKLDYSDRQGVMAAYEMYQNAVKEGYQAALNIEIGESEIGEEEERGEEIVFPWEDNEEETILPLKEKKKRLPLHLPAQWGLYGGGTALCGIAAGICYWQKNLLLCGAVLLMTAAVFYLLVQYGRQYKGIDSSRNTW